MVNCKHRRGTVNGICIDCEMPIKPYQLKFDNSIRRMLNMEKQDVIREIT